MNRHLQNIQDFIQQAEHLSAEEKAVLLKSVKDADSAFAISEFKLERTEKVKRTTAILLEETIEELEQKRKAVEQQNRELEIESALERVRARTMAMQKSTELQDAALELVQQVKKLGVPSFACGFNIWDDDKKEATAWMAGDDRMQPPFKTSSSEDVFVHIREAAQKGEQLFVAEQGGEELEKHYGYMATIPEFKQVMDKMAKAGLSVPAFQIMHCAFFSQGYLMFISFEKVPEAHDIFKRFAKVFEQTYTRFLDLQKSEAQARESQIQLALERVRARTMAMQHSNELKDAAALLFQQAKTLGVPAYSCGYNIWEQNENTFTSWMSAQDGSLINGVPDIPLTEDANFIRYTRSKEKGEEFFVLELRGERMQEHYEYLKTIPAFKAYFDYAISVGFNLPETQIHHLANFLHGNLLFITLEPCPEFHEVFKRFAKVFEQTYTRFLDLQKAEAQAKEAEIALALERVRARTMAMQNSDELREAVLVINEQLQQLNFDSKACNIIIIDKETGDSQYWVSGFTKDVYPVSYKVPHLDHPYYEELLQPWKRGEQYVVYEYTAEEKKSFDKIFFTETGFKNVPEEAKNVMMNLPSVVLSTAFFSNGAIQVIGLESISDEKSIILQRFAKVFDQTYTRFLDLKKAEEQAKEAQIEAALERVRSRTMGMQKSDELKEVIQVVYGQFVHLNIHVEHTGFVMDYKARDDYDIWIADQLVVPSHVTIPYFDCVYYNRFNEAKRKGENFFASNLDFEEKNRFYQKIIEYIPGLPEETKEFLFSIPGLAGSTVLLDNVCLYIENFKGIPYTDEENDTLMRFGKVFQQTYTRFLDLQKAEAQARESQIEAALERTRTQSMLMQHSDELDITSRVFHEQLLLLGIETELSFVWLPDVEKEKHLFWTSWTETENDSTISKSKSVVYDLDKSEPYTAECFRAWESGEPVHIYTVPSTEVKTYLNIWNELISGASNMKPEFFQDGLYYAEAFMKYGCFGIMVKRLLKEDEKKILLRFTVEFERTYTRFLDLQKAEEQAAETKIELSLERVRAKTMAMHNSADVAETVALMFDELLHLGISKNARCGIGILDPDDLKMAVWTAYAQTNENVGLIVGELDMNTHIMLQQVYSSWKSRETHSTYTLTGEDGKNYYRAINQMHNYNAKFDIETLPIVQYQNAFYFKEGIIYFFSLEQISSKTADILKRFAKVFGQTYTRYLDLLKAEAQAKEAQIEAALERVRSRTLAMRTTKELGDVVVVIIEKLKDLAVVMDANGVVLCTYFPDSQNVLHWMASPDFSVAGSYLLPYFDHRILREAWASRESGVDYFSKAYSIEEKNSFFEYAFEYSDYKKFPDEFKQWIFKNDKHTLSFAWQKNSAILIPSHTGIVPDEAQKEILKRFANVFEQAYIRFLDLQKAEAQAKESQIEAALERVRSRTLAMHKSDELAETSAVLFQQLIQLGIEPNRLYINIIKDEAANAEFWITDEDGSKVSSAFETNMNENSTFKKMYKGWNEKKKSLVIDMQGKELQEYFAYLSSINVPFKDGLSQTRRVQQLAYFNNGFIGIASPDEQSEETIKLLERFAAVFNLTYTRFHDLQFAEAQTHKANIEVALERVRARALAMQQPEELVEVAEVMRHEMGLLGVEELETSSIYINKENPDQAECWYSLKGVQGTGKNKVADHFDLNYNDTWVGKQMFKFYGEDKKETSIIMQGENRKEWINYCAKQSPVFQGYYGEVIPERTYHLCKFSNGAIGAATPGEISDESWELLRRAASVFSLAYSRFKDLTKARIDLQQLKEEKQRAETALTDLRATQTQLIQAEKMASLGELTAGIAHEIQNPLNFVNNFSEVSNELIIEMNAELMKGDVEEAKIIANDILQNLEKINHHGKRAADIVKGMLQHSRSSSSTKESTDVNKLVDEYLRLAYHGLRAKDKTFNASLKTDFDETVGCINIIPQDIGRVVLNLITNAFYVVNEKKQQQLDNYEPTVSVSTNKPGDKVEIRVKDNGNGISGKVLDKIFQPFFTTKPTGQGTGLGLSLAYDIVKAHGGELKVETEEGEGSEFIIQLPISTSP